ncbi:MAG: anti-sigma factor [Pseudomonadota bacterium]
MKKWYHHPETVDQLAAAYVLGTLAGPARRRFEAVLLKHPMARDNVAEWQQRLQPLAESLAPVRPSAQVLQRIEQRAFGAQAAAPVATPSALMGWLQRLLSPVPAGALALGLFMGILVPNLLPTQVPVSGEDTQLPQSYVGVLATADGKTGLIISSLRQGKVLDLKRVRPVVVPEGSTLYLWTIDAAGVAKPVGPAPAADFASVALPKTSEEMFSAAAELALSIEPVGSQPAAPSGAYVYRGLCGKLWKVVKK